MKTFSFHKMHGLGNDFLLIDGFREFVKLSKQEIAYLADRHCGIGFDQLLWLGCSKTADVECRIFNADGREVEQCGNGMRCVARYVHEENIIPRKELSISTKAGIIGVEIENYDKIRTNMGLPTVGKETLEMEVGETKLELTTLSLGNPHAIATLASIKDIPLNDWSKKIAQHQSFPKGVNIGFMQVLSPEKIRLRTHERGVGETLACGSNACAAALAGISQRVLKSPVEVQLPHGNLLVEWQGENHPVYLTGPASYSFSGTAEL